MKLRPPSCRSLSGTVALLLATALPVASGLLLATARVAAADSTAMTEQQHLLELKAAWVSMRHAATERDRYQRLLDLGLASEADFAAAETAYQVAQVTYQQRFLQLFSASPRVSVERCVKLYEGESRQSVEVTLRNSSAPALDYRSIGIVDDEVPMPDLERLREVRSIAVSLTDQDGIVLSVPYEQTITRIAAERSAVLRFRLATDVDTVRVVLRYAGRSESLPVYLEKDAAANIVRLSSRQFSQEANLGASALYDLRLERYGGSGNVYSLRVLGLPEEVGAELIDPETSARLSQVKLTEGVNSQHLQIRVFLPEVVSEQVRLDTPNEFWVAALSNERLKELPAGRELTPELLDRIRESAVRLELVPRGVGRLEVTAPSLFAEIEPGQQTQLLLTLRNVGTRGVDNIRLHADAPSDWQVKTEPLLITRLEPGLEQRVSISLAPPASVHVGDYPVPLRTEAYADNRRIDSQDQTARIQIVAPPSYLATGLLVLLVLAIVGGLVAWGIRVTRR